MNPSEEILQSIERRLRQLNQEIATLQAARARLSTGAEAGERPRTARKPPGRGRPRPPRAGAKAAANGAGELSDEEWVARRAAELAAQSRRATAA